MCVCACMCVRSMKCYKDWYHEEELQVSVHACVYACEINEALQGLVSGGGATGECVCVRVCM